MRGKPHYANVACISISPIADVTLTGEDKSLDPKLHLAITSDGMVTNDSNFDVEGKKTWGIY